MEHQRPQFGEFVQASTAESSLENPHGVRVDKINGWLMEQGAHPSQLEDYLRGNIHAVRPEIRHEAERIEGLNQALMESVHSPQAAAQIEYARRLLRMADEQAEAIAPGNDEMRAALRISQFEKVHVITDLDNTVTDHRGRSTLETFQQLFPGSIFAEPLLDQYGRRGGVFSFLFAAVWQQAIREFPEIFEDASALIPLRAGVDECFEYLEGRDIDVSVLSGNFKPFVDKVLERIRKEKGFKSVLSVFPDGPTITSVEKGLVIKYLIAQNPGTAILYFGDGESDWPVIEAKDTIAAYFALEGSSFARKLKEAGNTSGRSPMSAAPLYFTFKDFHDIHASIERIQGLSSK